jgi:subtilisin family serine protease
MSVGWCLGLVFGLVVAGAGPVGAQTERPAFVPGEVLIKLKDGTPRQRIAWILSRVGGQVMHRYRLTGALRVRLRKKTVAAAIGWLRRLSQVEYAEPNYVRYADLIPDDPQFPDLWGLDNTGQTGGLVDADIDAPEAWDITPGDPGIVVAVIDSGIDLSHPDLNIWTNPGEISGNGIDDDGNGFVDDVHGWDFADDDNDPTDSTPTVCASHGTHTAGTIGARGNNGLGVTGVNLDVTIMPLRALRRRYLVFCAGFDSDFIGAIQYAADKGVRISNNSYGSGPFSQAVFEAIRASKSIFVAAAGNDATDNDFNPSYPASYDLGGVISVAATDDSDLLAGFSNFGLNSVDLGAPGVDILSTVTGGYGVLSGTSMASPHVAGAAALLLASDPSLTNHEIVWRLANTTDFTNLPVASGGRLNVFNAIMFSPVVTIGLTPLGPTTAAPGETIDYSVRVANTGASAKTVHASVMVIFPDGHEFVLQERSLTVPGGVSRSENFSEMVPLSFPAGHYQLAARAQVATESYDEDVVDYELQ